MTIRALGCTCEFRPILAPKSRRTPRRHPQSGLGVHANSGPRSNSQSARPMSSLGVHFWAERFAAMSSEVDGLSHLSLTFESLPKALFSSGARFLAARRPAEA